MKKIKKLWNENRILMILGAVLIVCFIAILIVTLTYFVGSRETKYGSRLENMKTHITEKEQNKYIEGLEANENVNKVRFRVSGKTLYISVTFKDEIKLEDAKPIIEASLENFSDEIKETYDINYTIKNSAFTVMGSRNVSGNGLSWNNNNVETQG